MSPVYQAPYAVMKLRFFRNHKTHTAIITYISRREDLNDEGDSDPIAVASATVPRGPTGQSVGS